MRDLLVDSYARRITTLRVSLTERCNFRCVYCLPPEGVETSAPAGDLSADEITRFVRVAARLGVTDVRLTGGEPLLRRDVVDIVRRLRPISGLRELAMTTNGSLLARMAHPLRAAGLDAVNISLDSLDAERFQALVGRRAQSPVLAGVDAALGAGLTVKLNVVALRGMSDDEILAYVRLAVDASIDVRFLEFMPLCGSAWRPELVYPVGEIRALVARHVPLVELPRGDAPAQTFAIGGGRGRVGFIGSLTEPFCDRCSRIRLGADGAIRLCLFSTETTPVRHLLQRDDDDGALERAVRDAVARKPLGGPFYRAPFAGDDDTAAAEDTPYIRRVGG